MKLTAKTRIVVSIMTKDGVALMTSQQIFAKTLTQEIRGVSGFREVTIRMVVPSQQAEDLFYAISEGLPEMVVEGAPSSVERHNR